MVFFCGINKVMVVKENIEFKRGIGTKSSLDIGLGVRSDYFGFGKTFASLKNRNPGDRLWIKPKLAKIILNPKPAYSNTYLFKPQFNYTGKWGRNYVAKFRFKLFPVWRKDPIYLVSGWSGDYGFDGGEMNTSHEIGIRDKDNLTKQLYNHFLKIIDLPDE